MLESVPRSPVAGGHCWENQVTFQSDGPRFGYSEEENGCPGVGSHLLRGLEAPGAAAFGEPLAWQFRFGKRELNSRLFSCPLGTSRADSSAAGGLGRQPRLPTEVKSRTRRPAASAALAETPGAPALDC
ncbi:hypothetical protein P7K49_005457 [Saguinus oedipus]|uniref:Uncharacterized protein n=1 Tax=Saguinus oedipus TaxID=9490 RepID=A0ABQ9WAR2_SAGOE|nr:hypothetical protein P7K49_005457 [Saguinus oedipus]